MYENSNVRAFYHDAQRRIFQIGSFCVLLCAAFTVAGAQIKDTGSAPANEPSNPFLRAKLRQPEPRINLHLADSTLEYVLQKIAELTGTGLVYQQDAPALKERIHVSLVNVRLREALSLVLSGTYLKASISDDRTTFSVYQSKRVEPVYRSDVVAVDPGEEPQDTVETQVSVDRPAPSFEKPSVPMLEGVVTTATGKQRELEIGTRIAALDVDSIMRVAPVVSVTDLLEGRIPGLTVQRTSGTPGDPSRIRIRSMGSIARYNDPIIVVDGARMYSRQSDQRNLHSGGFFNHADQVYTQYATPSALDQMEPSIIDRIEVLKGPSASALYGSDAANGVIVITTKRGRSGPTRWIVAGEQGISYIPGDWFQEPYNPFGVGKSVGLNSTVAGGNSLIQYAYTGARRLQQGVLKLPQAERERYREQFGMVPPGWMTRPDKLSSWGGNGQVNIQVNESLNLTLTNLMNFQKQERSSMSNSMMGAVGELERSLAGGVPPPGTELIRNYYGRVSSDHHNMMMSMQAVYYPLNWIPINAIVGLGRISRKDANLVGRGLVQTADSTGFYGGGEGTATERSAGINTVLSLFDRFSVAFGMNAQHGKVSDLRGIFRDIPLGVSTPSSGKVVEITAPNNSWRLVGFFVEPKIVFNHQLYITPGLRVDNVALSGQSARYSAYPKVSVSWIASDDKNFPYIDLFNTLRFRAALGYGGVQVTAEDYLDHHRAVITGEPAESFIVSALEDKTMPSERSLEVEGGVDVEMLDGRLLMDLTYFTKTRANALVSASFLSSLPGFSLMPRLGQLRYSGLEVGVDVNVLQNSDIAWQLGTSMSISNNTVVKLQEGPPSIFNVDLSDLFKPEVHNPFLDLVLNSGLTLFRGQVGVFTSISFMSGLAQRDMVNEPEEGGLNILGFHYGPPQNVRALRIQTFSITGSVPERFTRLARVGSIGVALQGSNLGLWSNYTGIDPNVGAFAVGNATMDTGQLPQPRSWQLRVTLGW